MEITAKKRLGTHYAHYLYRHQETSWSSETLLSVVFAHRRVRLDVRVIQLDCSSQRRGVRQSMKALHRM